jgi:hypothetical protein
MCLPNTQHRVVYLLPRALNPAAEEALMLCTLARNSASQQSPLLRRRLRHAGLDGKKTWLGRNLGGKIGHVQVGSLEPCPEPVSSASGFELLCSYSWRIDPKAEPQRRSLSPQIYVPGKRLVAPVPPPPSPPWVPAANRRPRLVQERPPWLCRSSSRLPLPGGPGGVGRAGPSTMWTQTLGACRHTHLNPCFRACPS